MPRLIDAIMEAEKEAARIIEEAEREAKRIVEEAEEEARRIVEEAKSTPVEVTVMEDVDREVEGIISKAKAKVEELRKIAVERMESLVDEIVKEVIKGEWGGSS